MCRGCYEGEYGAPTIVSDCTRNAAELVKKVFRYSELGGNLHVQLDDWNIEDEFFEEFEVFRADASASQILAEQSCFEALAAMTIPERASAIAIAEGWLAVQAVSS